MQTAMICAGITDQGKRALEEHQQQNFDARISRLGVQDSGQQPPKQGEPSALNKKSKALAPIIAFVIGLCAVVLARYLRFRFEVGALTGETADVMMLVDIGFGIAAGILVKLVFRVKSPEYYPLLIVGVLVSVVMMHNLVHMSSGVFKTYFSPQWTEAVLEGTKPNTVLYRGTSYTFSEIMRKGRAGASSPEESEKPDIKVNQLPQVR